MKNWYTHPTKNIDDINRNIAKTKKIIVSVGCSFVYGAAAFSNELMEKYPPLYDGAVWSFDHYSTSTKKIIAEEYPNITFTDGNLKTSEMEIDNSFTSVLSKKYFSDWTAINLGVTSSGLFASVARLFLTPIDWHNADEIILIFCPTSMDRLDLINDDISIGNEFVTAWPRPSGHNSKDFNKIQEGYGSVIYSEKYAVLNSLVSWKFLQNWVKTYNAKLITFPAFTDLYTSEYFDRIMSTKVIRDVRTREIIDIKEGIFSKEEIDELRLTVPWDTFITPQGKRTFFDLAYSQEPTYNPSIDPVSITGKNGGTPNNWIMKCGHPGAKAHELLADEIYKHLTDKGIV